MKLKLILNFVNFIVAQGAQSGNAIIHQPQALYHYVADYLCDYIYLIQMKEEDLLKFHTNTLIEQLQLQNESSDIGSYTLNFNHPVKEIITGQPVPIPVGTNTRVP